MKYKLTQKLFLYFSLSLLSFAIIIAFSFSSMFKQSTQEQARADLLERAQTIAQSVSSYLLEPTNSTGGHMSGKHGMNNRTISTYLESLEAVTSGEVWIVDKDIQTIGRSHMHGNLSINDLPSDGEQMIRDASLGNVVFSEGFSSLLNSESISVGVPVYTGTTVAAVVLLHAPLSSIDSVIQQGYQLLAFYILFALLISIFLAYFLSLRFVRPLMKMRDVSLSIQDGDYTAQTNIQQNDELGELASSIDELSKQLQMAQSERDKLNHMRNEFFADISHELRTPVTVLSGTLETLNTATDVNQEQIQNQISVMQDEVKHLSQLINDLLDYSKLNTTDFSLNMETVNINDIVNDAIRSSRPLSNAKSINVTFESEESITEFYGDYVRLRQMISIILNNAIKFSNESSSVSLKITNRILTIQDYGKGISKEELPYIFNRFYKDEGTDNALGNGIGLAIAQQIANRHEITIEVESELGKGTAFIIHFQ